MPRELAKSYDPAEIEPRWARLWAESGWFRADAASPKPAWSLVIPPPNVTGSLHLGHMLEHTEIDAIVRWRRMRGDNVLWLPGTDHAGIATQMVVERQLEREGRNRRQLGREAFVARVWEWKRQSGSRIREQMVRLGASCDWSRERFTLDEGLSRAVREVFVTLYEEGLIYRGRYIVNWCPRCQTALSDLEVAHEETQGKLFRIVYPFADSSGGASGGITVATTRPETLLGDTAVAVHPEDERYRSAVDRKVRVPLTDREIPVIADAHAQPEFGTGAVKVTPAHDANDFAVGERHRLPRIEVLDEAGRMNARAGAYAGLDRFAARERIVADLRAAGLLAGIDEHAMTVGHCQRCGSVVEPRLSMQWFVRVAPLAAEAVAAVEQDRVSFAPENYRRIYLDWMARLHDWCISRQLWWGHRIPAWHCAGCERVVVAREAPAACPDCRGALEQDPDVLDTWFSSALWPFSTLGWPEQTADLRAFYPTSLLITGFDILFFWVARMLMMGVHFQRRDGRSLAESVPFRQVYIHGLVRDAEKQKMSKTRGNIIDPMAVTEKYGTDAVRFTLAAMAAPGADIALAESRMDGYRAFANKIWNAARFLFLSLDRLREREGWRPAPRPPAAVMRPRGEEMADRWIFARLSGVAERVDASLSGFRFHEAADVLYHFFWHEFCDWYLELAKPRLNHADLAVAAEAAENLAAAFDAALRLLHPLMPFITEELWQALAGTAASGLDNAPPAPTIALAPFPAPAYADAAAEREMALVRDVVTRVRNWRAERMIGARAELALTFRGVDGPAGEAAERDFTRHQGLVEKLANVRARRGSPAAHGGLVAAADYQISLESETAAAVAPEQSEKAGEQRERERQRLEKERDKLRALLAAIEARLASASFTQRAPAAVQAEERRKQAEYQRQLERLAATLAQLTAS